MANRQSLATIVFIPEIFDSELIDPAKTKATWPRALLRTRGKRESVDWKLGLVLGAKKLRPGKIIEKFGVAQTWARAKLAAQEAGFQGRQLVPLPYDWRREPLDAVLDLRAFTPPGDGPVIVVGHGYGGLIAKALVQARPAWLERVHLVAYLGVPHHGSDLDHLFAIARPMGWISDLTWETMCGRRCSVPTRSIAAMTRPWAFGVVPRLPGVKELDVFSASYPTLMRHPDRPGDELAVWPGDGLLLDLCTVRDGIARLETDRFHADMPACPKLWRHLARKLGIARPGRADAPASAAIHVQRSRLPAGVYVAGLRFQSRRNLLGVIEAREMTGRGGGFAPCKEVAGQNLLALPVLMDFTSRDGQYILFDVDHLDKFVVLRLYVQPTGKDDEPSVLLDERMIFLTSASPNLSALEVSRFRPFLGSAAHWRTQGPMKPRKWRGGLIGPAGVRVAFKA